MPLFIDAIDNDFFGPRDDRYRKWGEDFFSSWHLLFVNPIVTILAFAAYPRQARTIRTLPVGNLKSLSLLGLLTQGVVFIVVAISWTTRLVPDGRVGGGGQCDICDADIVVLVGEGLGGGEDGGQRERANLC
ncbi:hypothetical protein PoHVEF18_003090 [Penicillium ochrochloron]